MKRPEKNVSDEIAPPWRHSRHRKSYERCSMLSELLLVAEEVAAAGRGEQVTGGTLFTKPQKEDE